jgi:ribosomal protein S18 acetylase RimI-like enzyme
MNFLIRECNSEKDYDSFAKLSFETLVSIKGVPPGTSREEFYDWAKEWVDDFIGHLELNKIFIAENVNGNYTGHIWLSLEEELLPWEYKKYFWIQNVSVVNRFRNQGLGTKLMKYAENWIKTHRGKSIGLHVNIESEVAIHLYRKLKFTEYRTQFIKNLNLSPNKNDAEKKSSGDIRIKKIETKNELLSLENVLFKSFKLKVRNPIQDDKLHALFDKYFNTIKQNMDDHYIFQVLTKENQVCGYFIISIGEWRYNECIIIEDLGFIDSSHEADYFQPVYLFIENWTKNQNNFFVQIVLSKNEYNLMNLFKKNNFEIIGYFMDKKLSYYTHLNHFKRFSQGFNK